MSSVPNYKFQDTKQGIQISVNTISTDLDHLHDSFLHQGREEEEEQDEEEELIRVVLRRNPSGLSTCFDGFRAEKQNRELDGKVRKTFSMRADQEEKQSSSAVERAVRRAFSMRASASVNQVYRRMDHHYDPVPVGDEENTVMLQAEAESDKKRNKILEACRRFFGF
ncbi:hypothetical protein QQP08_026320 [Theobroma cacao]|uniref:Uncharacterized protein n=1 Tax=Theobroma cacao TaxID=3641 RepID=A0A061GZR9_THECC|nr:Uncharacterized protein TCM_041479 [Theobroma cacao]WRX33119.1 hypothetical protein QQP08_025606 [Theobroma cacao]WRX33833.1 hypothetical protein QQP08_026320 [Theobroma cacao]